MNKKGTQMRRSPKELRAREEQLDEILKNFGKQQGYAYQAGYLGTLVKNLAAEHLSEEKFAALIAQLSPSTGPQS
jgi:hypothetical protein